MSILIKGMEMPKNCADCKLTDSEYCTCVLMAFYDDDYYVGCYSIDRAPWCPLIELPPHGRLIDADAFFELLDGGYDLDFDEVPETKRELLRMINDAPTIIEAEADNG